MKHKLKMMAALSAMCAIASLTACKEKVETKSEPKSYLIAYVTTVSIPEKTVIDGKDVTNTVSSRVYGNAIWTSEKLDTASVVSAREFISSKITGTTPQGIIIINATALEK